MIFRPLGNTGMNVSIVGLGTVKLGRDQGVKYPKDFTIPDDQQASLLLDEARDLGINLIDTAPAYGNSEQRLGTLLKQQRQQWFICSKVGEDFDQGVSSFNFSAEHTRFSIERSLQRLKTDYIDMVLVHSDGNDLDIINNCGTLDTLKALKQDGKIRSYGMSTKTLEGGLLAAQHSDIVMVTLNLNEQAELPVVEYCEQNNKGCLVKKALASGHICIDKKDPIQASTDFIFKQPGVSSIIIGTINREHLRHNIHCAINSAG